MAKYLSKEEELHLGGLIQNMLKAKLVLEASDEISVNGDTNPENVKELSETVRKGVSAIEKLVEANVGLVYSRARAFKSRYPGAPEIDDLVQEGMTGLMTAVYKYDPVQGNKFSTVAYYWIVQAIGRGTNKTGRLVRLPENRVSDFINISKVRADFEESGLTSSEMNMKVMDETGLTFAEIVDITNAASTPASLNKVVNSGDGASKELIDYVGQDRASESSEELVVKSELMKILNERLEEMSEVARDVISSSFMMEGLNEKPLSSKVVREKHGLSSPRFKKILAESLVTLREDLKDIGVEFQDFLD